MIDKEEIEPDYHDDFLWIPESQRDTKQVNIDDVLRRIEENESN